MKTRKILSALLALVMLISAMGLQVITVNAYDPDNWNIVSDNRAKISFFYMGRSKVDGYNWDYGTLPSSAEEQPIPDDLDVGDMVYVGVAVRDLSKVADLLKPEDTVVKNGGVYKYVVSVAYDNRYLRTTNLGGEDGFDTNINIYRNNYAPSIIKDAYNSGISSTKYSVTSTRETVKIDPDYISDSIIQSERLSSVAANEARLFKNARGSYEPLSDDPVILGVFGFEIYNKPDAGTKVLQGALSGDRFTMSLNYEGTTTTKWISNVADEGEGRAEAPTNLKNYFTLTNADGTKPSDGVINLFPTSYKVTYDANSTTFPGAGYLDSVTVGTGNVETVGEGEDATLTVGSPAVNPSTLLKPIDGKVFEGWYTKDGTSDDWGTKIDNSDAAHTLTVTADTTLYAKYTDGHKITYNLNAADAKFKDSTTAAKGFPQPKNTAFRTDSATTLNDMVGGEPERTGYTFMGWYKKEADGTFSTKYTDTILDDDTNSYDLYAMWSRDSSSYTLKFNNNGGGTAADPATVGFNAGDTLTTTIGGMPVEPTKTDYVFKGWYKNESGDGDPLTASSVLDTYFGITGTDTLEYNVYARWDNVADKTEPPTPKDTNTIQVKFNKNGGEYKPSGATTNTDITDKYVKSGDKLKMPLDADMSYTGKAFGGWYTSNDGGTTLVTKVDGTTDITSSLEGYTAASPGPGGEITLYAKWLDKVKIEYDMNGLTGTKPDDQTDLIPGATDLTIAAAPTDIAADYSITKWNTKANGTGVSYTPGATGQTVPATDTKLYAIWDYNGADAITVTFDGNGTDAKPATLTPNDGGSNTGKYTVKRAPNYVITAEQQPTATRPDYDFDHWDASPSAATSGSLAAITVTDESGSSARTMTRYGIWKVSDSAEKVKVTFNLVKHADATGSDTLNPDSITPIEIASGDSLGSKMPANPTLSGGYGFDKWEIVSGTVTGKDAGDAFDKDDIVTADTTVKSDWTKEVKITFDANGGSLVGGSPTLDEIKVNPGSNVAAGAKQGTNDVTTLPTVERDGYYFDGWYDETDSTKEIEATTNLSSSVAVKAKWKAKISLDFTSNTATYDGTAKTPLNDSNIIVDLLNYTDNTVKTAGIAGFTASDFAIKYRKNGTSDAFATGDPTNADKYDIEVTMKNSDGHVGTDEFTVYTIQILKKNLFTIEQQEVNLKIKNNYQYAANTSGIVPMAVEVVGTAPAGFTLATDLVVKFQKGSDPATTTVPTDFGEYTVTIEPAASSNFKAGTISTDYDSASPAGDQNLHIIRTERKVNVDYGAGTHLTGTQVGSTGNVYTYKTVTIPTPSPVTKINDAKTALASQSPALDVPKEGTDFTAPSGKRIKYFVTDPTDETTQAASQFTKNTTIDASADDLTIYAIYENAEWTATFNDTKTTGKEDTVKYTIGAEKAIADASGTQKIETSPDDTTWTEDTSATKTVLPELENAPDNKTFLGWTKNKALADGTVAATGTYSALKASDFDASATYDGELFTDANKPGDSYVGTETNLQLYAVYVLSGDAKLKTVSLKEDNASGADAKFANPDYTIPATAITFDPGTDTYTAIISNGKDLFAELTPSQPGATITVTKATADATNTSPTGTAVSGISAPDAAGKVNFTSATDATTYTSADGNTVNQYKVKVTAPDGTEKTYTFNVLEYAEYKIELNPGNSPYGLIERMGKKDTGAWDKDKIQDAKDAFKNSDGTSGQNLTYGTGLVPDDGSTLVKYTSIAWTGQTKNYDMDENAVFVYESAKIKDPGIVIKNHLDQEISDPAFTTELKLREISAGVPKYTNDEGSIVNVSTDAEGYYNFNLKIYRPDVYALKYSYNYTDPFDNTAKTIDSERPFIIVSQNGDVELTASVLINANDATLLKNNWTTLKERSYLFAFRSADIEWTNAPLINANDATQLKNKWTVGFDQFYKNLNDLN